MRSPAGVNIPYHVVEPVSRLLCMKQMRVRSFADVKFQICTDARIYWNAERSKTFNTVLMTNIASRTHEIIVNQKILKALESLYTQHLVSFPSNCRIDQLFNNS